jgi:hypothetical protein
MPETIDFQNIALCINAEADKPLTKLLHEATLALRRSPEAARALDNGTFTLKAPLPAGYERRMNRQADELCARFNRNGWLFEIAECSPGCSGGWMGSCIPPSMYQIFLQAWISQQQSHLQFNLFG